MSGRRLAAWAALGALLLVVLVLGAWTWSKAEDAQSNLEQAREYAQQAKDALLQGNTENASEFADNARYHAQVARDATHSVPWNIVSAVPWIGSPLKTGQEDRFRRTRIAAGDGGAPGYLGRSGGRSWLHWTAQGSGTGFGDRAVPAASHGRYASG